MCEKELWEKRSKKAQYNLPEEEEEKFYSEWDHFVSHDVSNILTVIYRISSSYIVFIGLSCLFPQYFKRSSQPRQGNVCESSFAHCSISTTPSNSSRGTAKHHRYNTHLHTHTHTEKCRCNVTLEMQLQ